MGVQEGWAKGCQLSKEAEAMGQSRVDQEASALLSGTSQQRTKLQT